MKPTARTLPWIVGLTGLLLAGSLAAAGLVFVRIERTGTTIFLFMGWNLVLAWVPYLLALALGALHRAAAPGWLLAILGVVWLLFLPNAPYILTDFIHLPNVTGAPTWFDALLLGTFAGTGLLLGLASLYFVHRVVAARLGALAGWGLAIGTLALSSVGVYLGRVLRFNSWDVLTDPHGLVQVVLTRLLDPFGNPFLLFFGAAMTAGLVLSYVVTWAVGEAVVGEPSGRIPQYGG